MIQITEQDLNNQHSWRIPHQIITREGKLVRRNGANWDLPIVINKSARLKFDKIENIFLRSALEFYVIDRIQRTSSQAGLIAHKDVWRIILKRCGKLRGLSGVALTEGLISVFQKVLASLREEHRLYEIYLPVKWYVYCAEHFPEFGFCSDYAMELECIPVPGGPKGEAVRMNDPEDGALHRSLELPLIISALKEDKSTTLEHVRQRAAVALCLAFGRNPANLTFLREDDFINLTPDADEPCFILKIPRIKKRLLNPRDDFLEEYVDPFFAKFIIDLLNKNHEINSVLSFDGKKIPNPRPFFVNAHGNQVALRCGDFENAYNSTSEDITNLVQMFSKRNRIVSPITGTLLHLTTRRLRYTLATGLAAEGISKRELARILDHSDTQHVHVYFEAAGKIIPHLDKAAAHELSNYYSFFKGNFIASDSTANGYEEKHVIYIDDENPVDVVDIGLCGKRELCHLDPPFSCYLCPKFRAYDFADHEHVLNCLLESRERRLLRYPRLGVQLDDVIAAVAQVCKLCKEAAINA